MFIVIEGIDKTGKTSLAGFLHKRLNLEIEKFSAPKGDPYLEYMKFLIDANCVKILDRFYLGELAYGPVKRGKSLISTKERQNIEMTMMAQKPFLILTTSPTKRIRDNFVKDKEEYAVQKDILPLKSAYHNAVKTSMLKWHKFDYGKDPNYEKILEKILPWYYETMNKFLRRMEARETRIIGNTDAEVLIVGDVCNHTLKENKDPRLVVPFAFGRSAEYLYTALEKAKIDLHDVAITNYRKYHSGRNDLFGEHTVMPNLKRVVFLGKPKGIFTKTNDYMRVESVRHPSWAKRFNYPMKFYAKELRKAVYGK